MTSTDLRKTLHTTFEEARLRVVDALKTEGFGVLTEVDVQDTLQQKLGVEFRRYRILGACNPPFAHQALSIDLEAGLMMPCTIAMYEGDDGNVTVIAGDPSELAQATGRGELAELARVIRDKLARALAQLDQERTGA